MLRRGRSGGRGRAPGEYDIGGKALIDDLLVIDKNASRSHAGGKVLFNVRQLRSWKMRCKQYPDQPSPRDKRMQGYSR